MKIRPRAIRTTGRALGILCLAVLVACGQHAGVADQDVGAQDLALQAGSDPMPSSATGTAGSGTVNLPSGGVSRPGAPPPGSGAIDLDSEDATVAEQVDRIIASRSAPPGGSTMGIGDGVINLGMHFPMTGSAPNPYAASAEFNIYWNHLRRSGRTIGGRYVQMRALDDRSDPSAATSACKELAETGPRAFLLLGFAGPAPIQACALYAFSRGIPYLSPGSSKYPFEGIGTYFSLSAPYVSQIDAVARVLVDRLGARHERNAYFGMNGGNSVDRDRAMRMLTGAGVTFDAKYFVDAHANPEEISAVVLDMKRREIKNVYFAAAPYHFMYFWHAARLQAFDPQLAGPGLTVTVDGTLKLACGERGEPHGSLFFSPYPSFSERARWDRAYVRVVEKMGPRFDHELNWWIWNISKSLEPLLRLPGENLTRERFLWYTARARGIETGLMPPLAFRPDDHFSDESIHLLKAHCARDRSRWVGERSFVPIRQ